MQGPGILQLISAATRVAGVIGDPVSHSLSPALHNAAFAALGLDWVYVAFPVAAGRAGDAVAAMRALGVAGLSVTMPHKAAVAGAVDRLTPVARRLAGVNTVIRDGDDLLGDSTDGAGLVDALRHDEGWHPDGRRCMILGTGGAARAVALALAGAGAVEVAVVGRHPDAVATVVDLCGRAGRPAAIDEVDRVDLVVNATPVGMGITVLRAGERAGERERVGDGLPFDLDATRLGPGQMVVDLVYRPPVTPLLGVAKERGAAAVNGLGMLIHQAGLQLRAWTGMEAPLDAMSAAALAAIAHDVVSPDA